MTIVRMRLSYKHARGILGGIAGYSSVKWQSRKSLRPSEVEGPQDERVSWKLGTTINDNEMITEQVLLNLKLLNCADDALLNDVRPGFSMRHSHHSSCALVDGDR
jgi:hypothetical protein